MFTPETTLTRPGIVGVAGGRLVIVRPRGRLTPEDIDAWDSICAPVRARHQRAAIVTVVDTIPLPDGAVRARAAEVAARVRPGEDLDLIVLRGESLWRAAARAVIAGVYLLSRRGQTHEIVGTVSEAATVIANAGVDVDVDVARAAFDAVDQL